jgi:hypothetical protein
VDSIIIEPTDARDTGICECCGHVTRCVWGEAYNKDRCIGVYYVRWTLGRIAEHGANIDLILGAWGEDAPPALRGALALAYRLLDTGPAMMVVDAHSRSGFGADLVGHLLRRVDVIGTPVAEEAFAIADAVLDQDARAAELLGDWRIEV